MGSGEVLRTARTTKAPGKEDKQERDIKTDNQQFDDLSGTHFAASESGSFNCERSLSAPSPYD